MSLSDPHVGEGGGNGIDGGPYVGEGELAACGSVDEGGLAVVGT